MRHKQSEYMHWAKTSQRARYNLATSGVGSFPLRDLPFDSAKLEINGDSAESSLDHLLDEVAGTPTLRLRLLHRLLGEAACRQLGREARRLVVAHAAGQRR